jgi:hypothetical protein
LGQHATNKDVSSLLRIVYASLGVMSAAALAAYSVAGNHFFSPWNWLLILGLPVVAIIVFFRRSPLSVWLASFAWLVICPFLAFMATGQALGLGT